MSRTLRATLIAVGMVATILVANYVTSRYGLIPVGFGLSATAGTYLAGIAFILRDSFQDVAGRLAVIGLIVLGAVLSFAISDAFIALASGVAFLVSELADLAVYTPLRERGYIRAAVASNIVGAGVDTFLFLWIAGFAVTGGNVAGQIVGKLTVTVIAIAAVLTYRALRQRQAVTA